MEREKFRKEVLQMSESLKFDGDEVYDPVLKDWVHIRDFTQRIWDELQSLKSRVKR